MRNYGPLAKLFLLFIVTGLTLSLYLPSSFAGESSSALTDVTRLIQQDQIQIEDLNKLAILNNPELAAIRSEQAASDGRILQSSLKPNPLIEFEAGDVPVDSPADGQIKITYVQPFDSSVKRKSVIYRAKLEKESLKYQYEAQERDILGDVRLIYIELLSLRDALILYESLLEQAGETTKIAEKRYKVKSATETEVIKTRVEVDELRLKKERIENRLDSLSLRLETICGVEIPIDQITGSLPDEFPLYAPDELKEILLVDHPEIIGAEHEVKVAQARHQEAKDAKNKGYDLKFSYGHHFGEKDNLIEAGIEIPLTTNDKNQGNILETQNLVEGARSHVVVVTNELIDAISEAHEKYINARTEFVTLNDVILPSAQKVYDNTLFGYQYGKNSLLDVLDAQRTLFSSQLLVWESTKDANLALGSLIQIGGDSLDELPMGETK